MTTVTVSEDIKGKAADVWAALSDFGAVPVGGAIKSVDIKGKGVGMVRTIGLGGANVVERLDRFDPKAMVFVYSIINDDCPLPVKGYVATVKITDKGDGTTNVNWSGTFQPKGPEADAVKVVEGIYEGLIARGRRAVGG